MFYKNRVCFFLISIGYLLSIVACRKKEQAVEPIFEALGDDQTGLHFTNKLNPTEQFNMFKYMYFYNGAGVGAGDFNNDGLTDLFFASNQGDNKLFINEGKLHFKDVTAQTHIPQDHGWSTGVSVVDINNDGLLDIYICKVGQYESLQSKNQLLICKGIKDGIPVYEDEAATYGLDFSGFSTQAVFFDYDMDGDLDMFLLNHSVHQNGTFAPRDHFLGTYHPLSGDRLYRNETSRQSAPGEGGTKIHFTDVTKESHINSSAIGYGLGIAVADINLDGWPDLYIGNDFHENDYLYINQRNGTFSEENEKHLMHTSQFSMGVDVADANNDGFPDIVSMDMLPSDPYILKRSLGEDEYDIFYYKISAGYTYQYSRNNLQYNRRNGMFSELGLYAGVYATDWSWAPLWMDFDNDGLKDLFISNGIPKRMNDMDYVNFIYDEEMQKKLKEDKLDDKDMSLINKFPEIKIPNKFFRNQKDMQFMDEAPAIKNDRATYSNGAIYADLDNDGDLDVVVNNIDEPVLLYENKANDNKDKAFAEITLKGPENNINATGSKVVLFADGGVRTYEKNPVKGFESSMEIPLHIGLAGTKIDSAFLIWPDNSFQSLSLSSAKPFQTYTYQKGLPAFDYDKIISYQHRDTKQMEDITEPAQLEYVHHENAFPEFSRDPLAPHMVSTEGPALAVADINHDGLDDVFIGSSKTFHNAVFLQQADGHFVRMQQTGMDKDSMYEDVDAVWTDINADGNPDLVIATGGNEYYGDDEHQQPLVYLNDGHGSLQKINNAFSGVYGTFSCVAPCDFNGDGFMDLFIGGRVVPMEYGQTPRSYLLQNDGTGKFTDVTATFSKDLLFPGMVTSAAWYDMDKDGNKDLVIASEWGGIDAYLNRKGHFTKKTLTAKKGWWNFIKPVDIDNDGDIDLVAGNLGLNSRLTASEKQPVRLYYNDFDDNGKKEQVLTYYLKGKEIPFANKDELTRRIPLLKKKFLYAENFAKATLEEMFTKQKLEGSTILTADYLSNAILINDGKMNFAVKALPWEAQLTSYRDAVVVDANGDNRPDILLAGNYYDNNIQMGRYDADFGTVLVNKGKDSFSCQPVNGINIKGQARKIRELTIGSRKSYVIARNNDSTMVISFK